LENDRFIKFALGSGFCEVLKDSVTVLVEEAYSADQIDAAAASSDVAEYEQQLAAIDSAADPEGHQEISNKLKVARAKVAATG
jgi:F0F1-type ATP synthase epsilon subunit